MDSGMGVNPECVQDVPAPQAGKTLRYIIYGLNNDNKEIVVLTKKTE
ncbi:hypothetical protein ACFV4M_12865 [Kitasatospora indigofera]